MATLFIVFLSICKLTMIHKLHQTFESNSLLFIIHGINYSFSPLVCFLLQVFDDQHSTDSLEAIRLVRFSENQNCLICNNVKNYNTFPQYYSTESSFEIETVQTEIKPFLQLSFTPNHRHTYSVQLYTHTVVLLVFLL